MGAVVGGLSGKGVAKAIDPTVEEVSWRENHASRDYIADGRYYGDYDRAYGDGVNRMQASARSKTSIPNSQSAGRGPAARARRAGAKLRVTRGSAWPVQPAPLNLFVAL